MKKFFTLAAAVLASMAMSAEVIYSYTLTAPGADGTTYEAVGGTAKCLKAMASTGSNEITIGDQTFYKFNSSSAWECTLSEGTFEAGDVVSITAACTTSAKKGKGVTLNGISVTGDFEASEANTLTYTVVEGDAIAGQATIKVMRADSDIKFGTISVARENVTPSTDPVTEVSITGDASTYVGGSATLKASAKGATEFWWTLKGNADKLSETNTLEYHPTVAGELTFVAYAQNEYNTTPASAEFTVSIASKLCGELIKAVHVNGKTATVTGVVGGTADKNTQDGGKLGSNGHYFGVKLASGSFMAGDVVTIVASALNGGNTATIYSDKGEKLLGSVPFDSVFVDNDTILAAVYTLDASADAIYVYRASSACNPNIASITVTRACEASSNAGMGKLTINGAEVEAVENVYSYEVSASENLAQVEVVYTLAHPLATATPASGFKVNVPAAGAAANTQVITVTAEDGETKANYTVSVTKSASLSTDATLSALTVEGYTLTPAFAADVMAYTITKAYTAENPAVTAVTATPTDDHATAVVTADGNVLKVTVTAEDGTTQKEYTITVERAAAKKDLLEVTFSNGVHGFIANGEIKVPYLAGTTQPTFVSARFWNADGEPSATVVDGKLVVTGIDEVSAEYTLTYEELTPMTMTTDTITFDTVPNYIYSVYGWDANKGVKFSKDVEEAANKRISEGKCRIYIALPAAKEVALISGTTGARPVTVSVNGVVNEDITKTADKGKAVVIALNGEAANLVAIESNGNSGDAGFVKMVLAESTPTGVENTEAGMKAVKVMRDGKLFIEKNGVLYNAQGVIVK